jgi:hypothetical protein
MRADRHLAAEGPATDMQTQPQWQQNHLIDLHQQLQAWACELDAREATLTAYSAVDDHRRRQICLRKLRRESQQASPPRLS